MKTSVSLLSFFALNLVAFAQQPIGSPNNSGSDLSRALRAGVDAFTGGQQRGQISLQQVTANWNQTAREAARQMFDKYGAPQEVTANRLIWQDARPWKSIEVTNEEVAHNFPVSHTDVLKQTLAFDVPAEKFTELAEFDGSILAERTAGELSACCDREANNFIALNLAHDIIDGKISAQQARQRLTELVQSVKNGQQPSYATGVQFSMPVSNRTGDADHPASDNPNQNWQRIGW